MKNSKYFSCTTTAGKQHRGMISIFTVILIIILATSMLASCTKQENTQSDSGTSATVAKTTSKASISKAAGTTSKTEGTKKEDKNGMAGDSKTGIVADDKAAVTDGKVAEDTGAVADDEVAEDTGAGNSQPNTEEIPAINLGGKTVILSIYGHGISESAQNDALLKLIADAERKYNFKMEITPFGTSTDDYTRQVTQYTMAGVRFADIAMVSTLSHYLPFIVSKAILPLDDYIDFEDPIIKAYNFLYNFKYRGKHYAMTTCPEMSLGSGGNPYNIGGVQYNTTILNREGLPDILDLYEAGLWDWSTFLDICKATTKDINGDGVLDQWGLISQSNFYLAQQILYSNGVVPLAMEGDTLKVNLYSPAAQRALQFVSDLAYVHKVYKTGVASNAPSFQAYANGEVAMFLREGWINYHHLAGTYGSPLPTSVLAPLPIGPDATTRIAVGNPTLYCLLTLCDNPEQLGIVLRDMIVAWDMDMNLRPDLKEIMDKYPKPWEEGGLLNRSTSTEREYNLNFDIKNNPFAIDFYLGIPNYAFYTPMTNLLVNPIMNGTKSVAQAIESSKDTLNAVVNDYLGQ